MQIIGPDALVFGVDDVAACAQFLADYGLTPVGVTEAGGRFDIASTPGAGTALTMSFPLP